MRSFGLVFATLALAACSSEQQTGGAAQMTGSPEFLELVEDARVSVADGNLAEAGGYYDEALAIDPENPGLWVDIARLRFRGGEHLIALDAVDYALELDPDHPSALLMRAQIVRDTYGLSDALPWFETALRANPQDPEILADYAATLGDAGRYREMLRVIRELAVVDPGYSQVHYQQAVIAARVQDPVLASILLQRSGQSERQVPSAMLLDAIIKLQQGNFDTSVGILESLRERVPGNVRVNELLARALWLGGRDREIIEQFSAMVEAPGASPYLTMIVGRSLERSGERERGLALVERAWDVRNDEMIALASTPRLPEATAAIRASIASGDVSRANGLVSEYARRLPHSADIRALAGDAALAAGDAERALEQYEVAARVRRSWPLTRKLFEAYRTYGDGDAAEALLIRHIAGDPQNVEALLLLARASAARDDWLRVAVLLDSAIEQGAGNDLDVLALRAEAASALGREDEAAQFDALRSALKPGDFISG